MVVDIHTHILPKYLPDLEKKFGYGGWVSLDHNSNGTANVDLSDFEISKKITQLFDLKPAAIINQFNLKDPIYTPTASYGHMGREPQKVTYKFDGMIEKEIELFPWEKLDYVEKIKNEFNI